jgi:expansin (peptidoglycan-binding protein)
VLGAGAPNGGGAALGGMAGTFTVAGHAGSSAGAGGPPSAGASSGGASSGGANSGGANSGGLAGAGGTGGAGGTMTVNPPGTCKDTYEGFKNYQNNGSVTFYTFDMGTGKNVHCSYGIQGRNPDTVGHTYTSNGRYFAAMNTADYRASAACGSCVEVSGSDGRKVTVTIVDECPIGTNPKCTAGHLDLSREAFRQIANESEGHVGTGHGGCCRQISWKYVPCPVPADKNVTFRLKEPTNEYYTTVIVQDHRFPIKSLQIKGMEATRQADNFWIVGNGNLSPGPWPVRAVDVNDWIYEATLSLGQAEDVSSGSRAMCQ